MFNNQPASKHGVLFSSAPAATTPGADANFPILRLRPGITPTRRILPPAPSSLRQFIGAK